MPSKKKVVSVDDATVSNTEPASVTAPKKLKVYAPKLSDTVEVVNMFPGHLNYVAPGSSFVTSWDSYGAPQYMTISDLIAMRNSQPSFFRENWIMVNDPHAKEILNFLRVSKFYENFKDADELLALFDKTPDEFASSVSGMTPSIKETVARIAYSKLEDGTLDSKKMIKAIEDSTGFILSE